MSVHVLEPRSSKTAALHPARSLRVVREDAAAERTEIRMAEVRELRPSVGRELRPTGTTESSARPFRAVCECGHERHADELIADGRLATVTSLPVRAPITDSLPIISAPSSARRPVVHAKKRRGYHLTQRGRLIFVGLPVLVTAALLLVAAGLVMNPVHAEQNTQPIPSTPAVLVTVQPGQSLWEIAEGNSQGRDPRAVVSEIIELNGLEGATIEPGRKVYVPVGA